MSVQSLLTKIAGAGAGIQLDNDNQRQLAIDQINSAAEELYRENDLIGSLWAQYVRVENQEGMMISLPHYVGAIRAVRLGVPNMNVGLVDMRPRFQARVWAVKNALSWALKGESPIKKDITNEGPLTILFSQPVEKTIKITITGETAYSAEDREVLTFVAGQTSQVTTKAFRSITPTKDVVCQYDCVIIDLDGEELASIPNNQLRSLYLRAMVYSPPTAYSTQLPSFQFYELLWKYRYKPLINLTDEFQCPGYDDAIFWKFLAHRWINKQTSSPEETMAYTAKASEYMAMASQEVKIISKNAEQSIEKIINISQEPVLAAFEELESYYTSWDGAVSNVIKR